jgi:hypothetical protein
MSTNFPVTELARRMCIASHRADLRPESGTGLSNVPCGTHLRLGQLYYGLIDEAYYKELVVINQVSEELRSSKNARG